MSLSLINFKSQVEGAFVQGMGWVALEEVKWGDKEHQWLKPGSLFTQGPGTYKLPTANDIPCDFRVSLLKVCYFYGHSMLYVF